MGQQPKQMQSRQWGSQKERRGGRINNNKKIIKIVYTCKRKTVYDPIKWTQSYRCLAPSLSSAAVGCYCCCNYESVSVIVLYVCVHWSRRICNQAKRLATLAGVGNAIYCYTCCWCCWSCRLQTERERPKREPQVEYIQEYAFDRSSQKSQLERISNSNEMLNTNW